jgi:hypothetical protein
MDVNRDQDLVLLKQALQTELRTVHAVLATLTPREEVTLRHLLGLRYSAGQKPKLMRHSEIAKLWDISYQKVSAIERNAWKKLQHPINARKLLSVLWAPRVSLNEPLACIKSVSPELMRHLKHEHTDIAKVPAHVFEEIVAELLSGMGWKEIRLVGRSSETSADILAGHFLPDGITPIRVFIEIKRWKDQIGVEVFNQVLGAMVSERERFGWHQAWIVALGGASDTRKFSREEWRAKGLEVKDKADLFTWLDGYQPNQNGLWLPPDVLKE